MENIRHAVAGRHASTAHFAPLFSFEHLPPHLAAISESCHDLAVAMISRVADGPELTTGLRKLLEAKDCFVRQAVLIDLLPYEEQATRETERHA